MLSKGKPKTFNPIKDRKNRMAKRTVHGTVRQQDGTYRTSGREVEKTESLRFGQRFNGWDIPSVKILNGMVHPAEFPGTVGY